MISKSIYSWMDDFIAVTEGHYTFVDTSCVLEWRNKRTDISLVIGLTSKKYIWKQKISGFYR